MCRLLKVVIQLIRHNFAEKTEKNFFKLAVNETTGMLKFDIPVDYFTYKSSAT